MYILSSLISRRNAVALVALVLALGNGVWALASGERLVEIEVVFAPSGLVHEPKLVGGQIELVSIDKAEMVLEATNVVGCRHTVRDRLSPAFSMSGPWIVTVLSADLSQNIVSDLQSDPLVLTARLPGGTLAGEQVASWFPPASKDMFCSDQSQFHRRVTGEPIVSGDECSGLEVLADYDMDQPQGWAVTRGDTNIVVAIIDTGFDLYHPNLGGPGPAQSVTDSLLYYNQGIWFRNWKETPGDASGEGLPGLPGVNDDPENDPYTDEDCWGNLPDDQPEPGVFVGQWTALGIDTIEDSGANWTVNELVGRRITLTGPPTYGSTLFYEEIVSNTATEIVTSTSNVLWLFIDLYGTGWSNFVDPAKYPHFTHYKVGFEVDSDSDGKLDDLGYIGCPNDDDENGYEDDFRGWDFFDWPFVLVDDALVPGDEIVGCPKEDYTWQDNDPRSFYDHGTTTSGLIASVIDSGRLMGTAPRVKVLPLRFGAQYNCGYDNHDVTGLPIEAIEYAIQMGVDVISLSYDPNSVPMSVVNRAVEKGIVVVVAAGNSVHPLAYGGSPPAEGVLFVGGLNNHDGRMYIETADGPYESNYGPWVDVSARSQGVAVSVWGVMPYHNVPGDTPTPWLPPERWHGYSPEGGWSGTSLSAPIVAGVVALVRSAYPQWSVDEVVNKVKQGVDDIYSSGQIDPNTTWMGTGRVNTYKALTFYGNVAALGDTTWAHNIWIGGDVRVPDGNTLTIAAGDTVRVAIDDLLSAGLNPNEIEFVIDGDLQVNGSSSAPIVFERFDDSGQYWEYDATFSISGETFTLGGLGCATIASAAHSPLVPDNGTASQVFSIEVQENASLDSVDVDLAGLGLNGTTLQLLDDGQGEDLLASDGIFTSAPFTALVSGGLGYSVDVTAYATAGGYTRRSVAVEVPPVMAVLNDVSSESGLSYQGTPYSGVVSQIDGGTLEDLVVTISSGFPSVAFYSVQILPSGTPFFAQGVSLQGFGGRGATSADYDNDGDEDLFIAHGQSPKLYRNDAGTYVDVTSSVGLATLAAGSTVGCWGDYDNDGWLDLFVTRCVVPGTEPPGYDNIESANHRLFRNLGGSGGGFADVTSAAGLQSLASASVAASWGDIDNDGDLDLAVLSLAHPPEHEMAMLVNQGDGTFIDEFMSRLFYVGTDIYYGTGVVWADMNNDGWLDMAVSCAGAGSQVLLNDGQGRFPASLSVLLPPVIGAAGTCYSGLQVFDHDLDGWQDILLVSRDQSKPSRLFLGRQVTDGIEYLENTHNVALAHSSNGMGVVAADFTADGDVDVFVGRSVASGEFFYKTDNQADANSLGRRYVKVRLDSPDIDSVNRQGVGAVVTVTAGGLVQTQIVDGGSGRGGQKDRTLIFGLDDYSSETVVATVTWPGGTVQSDVDLIVSGAGVGETVNIISDAKPVLSNVKAEMLIDPVTNVIDWRFSWDTIAACKTQADLVTIDQEGATNPCLPGWTTVTPTSPGASYTYKAGDNGGYSHVLTISNWDCNQNCSYWYTAKSDGGLKPTTSSPILKRVKFCPSQF